MNSCNDPSLRSFVSVPAESYFPIQNLPFGVFSRKGRSPRIGVAIGELVLDLSVLDEQGLLSLASFGADYFRRQNDLKDFMGRGPAAWRAAREAVSRLLRADEPMLRDNDKVRE